MIRELLARLSQPKSALGVVQLISAAGAIGTFFLFYILLGNALWLAVPLALAAFGALWQLLVAPLQQRLAKAAPAGPDLAAIERKIVSLQTLAGRIPNPRLNAEVGKMSEHFGYALQVQRTRPEPMAVILAQTLTGLALDSTHTLISSYLNLLSKRHPNRQERESIETAQNFIFNLTAEIHNQALKLRSLAEDTTEAQTGIEANMAALQMLFNNIDIAKEGGDS
ncbi:MAG TPA: hypothetical protein VJ302_14505 [Blastocatellia bacterium]|nr:hypothetical protein [Blastocatellia bacterium]